MDGADGKKEKGGHTDVQVETACFLCGGFALIDAFVEFLTDALSVPVEMLNPFSTILHDPGVSGNETLEKDGPAFAVAAGLAMRTL